eukprot:88349-Rhodomonas_salina.3
MLAASLLSSVGGQQIQLQLNNCIRSVGSGCQLSVCTGAISMSRLWALQVDLDFPVLRWSVRALMIALSVHCHLSWLVHVAAHVEGEGAGEMCGSTVPVRDHSHHDDDVRLMIGIPMGRGGGKQSHEQDQLEGTTAGG